MAKNSLKVPPFVPTEAQAPKAGPMVVMTIRMDPRKRDACKMLWRQDASFNSVSHVIQTAIDEFLDRRS